MTNGTNNISHKQLEQLLHFDRKLLLANELKLLLDINECKLIPSIICFDLASLRKINDVYGWDIGDKLLASIKDWVLSMNIPDSCLYRIGDDEFCLSVTNIDIISLKGLTNRIHNRFNEPWVLYKETNTLHVFCSVFVGAVHCEHLRRDTGLMSLIERIMDSAKKSSSPVFYDEKLDREAQKRLEMELSLAKCVKNGMVGFDVYYQPIVDPINRAWCGLEALCRWNSPDIGIVQPDVFIPEAERQGLILLLGEWVLDTAVGTCKSLGLDRHKSFLLNVNLSAIQFLDSLLVQKIINVLEKYDYPGDKLCLEVTESVEFNFNNHTMDAINALVARKILVSVDDFGTGYSSFHRLKNLPVQILKTERAFIQDLLKSSYAQYLFFVMVELAHVSNMKLIAEGVENAEQMDILIQSGVDYMQGYLFGKPMPACQLEEQLYHFHGEDEYFSDVRNKKINLSELLDMDSGYKLSSYMNQLLSKCLRILFYNIDFDDSINQILEIIGREMNVSRSYVFLRDEGNFYSNTHEWCADGIKPMKDMLTHVNIHKNSKSWIPMLQNDGLILARDISELPDDICRILKAQGIRSIAIIPLWDNDTLFGFVGCDDCVHNREWRHDEILMLHQLCMILANLQKKQELQEEVTARKNIMETILDSIDIDIYVSDLETGKILFANTHLIKTYGDVIGHDCREVLHNEGDKFGFRKLCQFSERPELERMERDYYNPIRKRHYRVCDSVIPWDKSKAHLEYAIDVTDLMEYQNQLEAYASMDVFTGTLNRDSLARRLRELHEWSVTNDSPISICFVDLDNLKYANDVHGHAMGDLYIKNTVKALRENIRETDMIGRYGGDEFIVALKKCSKKKTEQKMENARQSLKESSAKLPFEFAFSYGIAESTELMPNGELMQIDKLLEIADKRMMCYKTRNKA